MTGLAAARNPRVPADADIRVAVAQRGLLVV